MDLSEYVSIAFPLHKVCQDGKEDVLEALLQTGRYKVNFGSFDLVRPLHVASLQGHLACVRVLLEYGAEVNIRNIDGSTPLCDACSRGNLDIVNLLIQRGASVNPPLTMSSPLHETALYNRWECAEVLLRHGANPDTSDCHYGTPLLIAASRGHLKTLQVLLRFGANVRATHIHTSALHASCRRQDCAMTRALLEHGADVYAEDNQGRTPRDLATVEGDKGEKLKLFLLNWEKNPKSLSHYCRLAVKQAVGNQDLFLLQDIPLPIPQVVKDFLQFRPQKTHLFLRECNKTDCTEGMG